MSDETIPYVVDWTGGKLTNGSYLSFSKSIVTALKDLDFAALPIGELIAELETVNDRITDFINETRRYVDTGAIAAADEKRDRLFKAIYFALEQLSQIDGELSLAVKARTVFNILAAYKGAYSHAITKETEELQGLSFDIMKTPAAVEALTGLGLLPWFNALAAANEEVDNLYQHRTGERADREHEKGEDSTISLRKTAVTLVSNIIRRVNAFNEVNPTDASKTAAIRLDGIIKQYKDVAAQTGKRKKDDPEPNAANA